MLGLLGVRCVGVVRTLTWGRTASAVWVSRLGVCGFYNIRSPPKKTKKTVRANHFRIIWHASRVPMDHDAALADALAAIEALPIVVPNGAKRLNTRRYGVTARLRCPPSCTGHCWPL